VYIISHSLLVSPCAGDGSGPFGARRRRTCGGNPLGELRRQLRADPLDRHVPRARTATGGTTSPPVTRAICSSGRTTRRSAASSLGRGPAAVSGLRPAARALGVRPHPRRVRRRAVRLAAGGGGARSMRQATGATLVVAWFIGGQRPPDAAHDLLSSLPAAPVSDGGRQRARSCPPPLRHSPWSGLLAVRRPEYFTSRARRSTAARSRHRGARQRHERDVRSLRGVR
jgi:hypothetical protein